MSQHAEATDESIPDIPPHVVAKADKRPEEQNRVIAVDFDDVLCHTTPVIAKCTFLFQHLVGIMLSLYF